MTEVVDGEQGDAPDGAGIINADFAGTGALLAASLAGAAAPDTFGPVTVTVALVLFAAGTVALLWAFALGVSRSRDEVVTLPGLFFVAGAPSQVAFRLRLALALQVVAAVAAASIRPFTVVAFAVLGPMLGIGLMGLWGGRHVRFPARDV